MVTTSRLALPLPQASDSMSVNPPAFATLWSNVDAAIGPTFCTSSTRPATPYACQWIYQTDTNGHFIWDPVASAWVHIIMNPTGIVAYTNAVNNTNVTTQNTTYLCTSLNAIPIESNRNYIVHVEGIFGYTGAAPNTGVQFTEAAKASIVYNASTGTAANVTTGSTQLQSQYVDAYGLSGAAQRRFTFEGLFQSGSNLSLSVGWTLIIPTFNTDCSGFYIQNCQMYVEQR